MIVGIIGLGNFGRFAANVLGEKGVQVKAYDPASKKADGISRASLKEVAQADVVVLAVPLSAYNQLLPKLSVVLPTETLVVDICSVKTEAHKRLFDGLPNHPNLLVTHPMFGPQSAANGTAGHVLVVTEGEGPKINRVLQFCREQLGLKIMRMTDEQHDRTMADVHALTFFIARGLARTGLESSPFQAPSFQMLLDLVQFDKSHSEDLFRTIELGNPFAGQARARLLAALTEVDDALKRERI